MGALVVPTLTFIKAHWLDALAWICAVAGAINVIGGLVTWDTASMSMGAVAMFIGVWVLER